MDNINGGELTEQRVRRMFEIWSELVSLRWKHGHKPLAEKELRRKKVLEEKLVSVYLGFD